MSLEFADGMLNTSQNNKIDALSTKVLLSLLYFDVFKYPLTAQEVYHTTQSNTHLKQIQKSLNHLVEQKMLYQFDQFYSVQNNAQLVERRLKGNELAKKRLDKAYQMSAWIARFPYVRAVCLSGSISKNYMEEDSDIDYFVITQAGRLWVARTLLKLYRVIFLLNNDHNFCVNYFIDEKHLEIEEQNLFTATELVTTIPSYNPDLYSQFRTANNWSQTHYPNFPMRSVERTNKVRPDKIKNFLEKILNTRLGEFLDTQFMKMTIRHWQRKFGHFDPEDLAIAFKSRKHVSKQHSNHFQRKILDKLDAKINAFEQEFQIQLRGEL